MELKEYLKNARKNVGLTQEEAANKIDISISTIQNLESGRVKFSAIDLFSNIIKVYQLDKEEFYVGELKLGKSNFFHKIQIE